MASEAAGVLIVSIMSDAILYAGETPTGPKGKTPWPRHRELKGETPWPSWGKPEKGKEWRAKLSPTEGMKE